MSNLPAGGSGGVFADFKEHALDVMCDHPGRGTDHEPKMLVCRIGVSTFVMAGYPDSLGWDIHELPHPSGAAKRSRYGLSGQTERARSEMEKMTDAVWRFECPACGLTASFREDRLRSVALRLAQNAVGEVTVGGLVGILG